jgi:hypothetical protein
LDLGLNLGVIVAAIDARMIYAPVVLFSRNVLSVVPEEGLRVMEISIPASDTMLRKSSAKKGFLEPSGWILEVNGRFREFKPRGIKNGWAAPLSSFIQLVKSEFDLTEGRNISAGELSLLLRDIKDDFQEAPQAADLRRHLRKYPEHEIVTERMLRDWPI